MFRHFTFAAMICLSVWVASVTIRIEIQNAAADYFLPRKDTEGGKWRLSRYPNPANDLRHLVDGIGLLQYMLAPVLLLLSCIHFSSRNPPVRRWLAMIGACVGVAALGFAIYRGYISSLGW